MTVKQFASLGGKARAAKLSSEQRKAIGKAGGLARAIKAKLQASIVPTVAK